MGKKKYIMTTIVQMSPHQEHSIAREEEVWLEEVEDCPASECDGEECECPEDKFIDKITRDYPPTETDEPNESLEDIIATKECFHNFENNIERIKWIISACKSHYQEHPEEIDCVKNGVHQITIDLVNAFRKENKGLVSIDEVLRKIKELKNEGS